MLEMCRRLGRDLNFLGVIVQRTNWTSLQEKQFAARRVGELAAMHAGRLGALGGHTASYWPDFYGWGKQTCREF